MDSEEGQGPTSEHVPSDQRSQDKPSSADEDTTDRDSQPEPTYQQDLYDNRYGGTKRRNAFAQRFKKDEERF